MKLEVGKGAHGRGVYAAEPIRAGTPIMPFSGPLLHYAQTSPSTYALQIGPDLYIGKSGALDDLFNHSCDPNAEVRISGTSAELRAIRDIAPGEQIVFDYSTTLDEGDFTMLCQCGSPLCRGRIGDGRDLPQEVWDRYLKQGILADYVVKSRLKMTRS
jgi:hypothetical protein